MREKIPASASSSRRAATLRGAAATAHEFSRGDAQVTVTVPASVDATPAAGSLEGIPDPANGRLIMNLKLQASGKSVTSFAQPFELRIRVTDAETQLQYYDGSSWQIIPDRWVHDSKHKFGKAGGELVVLLKEWPADPGIGSC